MASLCRDVDALVEKIRQADNALVLRSTPVMEVHGDHGGVVGEQGDDFEEIDVEKSLKKSPWVIDGDGMSSKGGRGCEVIGRGDVECREWYKLSDAAVGPEC